MSWNRSRRRPSAAKGISCWPGEGKAWNQTHKGLVGGNGLCKAPAQSRQDSWCPRTTFWCTSLIQTLNAEQWLDLAAVLVSSASQAGMSCSWVLGSPEAQVSLLFLTVRGLWALRVLWLPNPCLCLLGWALATCGPTELQSPCPITLLQAPRLIGLSLTSSLSETSPGLNLFGWSPGLFSLHLF